MVEIGASTRMIHFEKRRVKGARGSRSRSRSRSIDEFRKKGSISRDLPQGINWLKL